MQGSGVLAGFQDLNLKVNGVSRRPAGVDFVAVVQKMVKESAPVMSGFERGMRDCAYGLVISDSLWGWKVVGNDPAMSFVAGNDVVNGTGLLLGELPRPGGAMGPRFAKEVGAFRSREERRERIASVRSLSVGRSNVKKIPRKYLDNTPKIRILYFFGLGALNGRD